MNTWEEQVEEVLLIALPRREVGITNLDSETVIIDANKNKRDILKSAIKRITEEHIIGRNEKRPFQPADIYAVNIRSKIRAEQRAALNLKGKE